MKNLDSPLNNVEFQKPVKILEYYGYGMAGLQVEYENRYVLNDNWSSPDEMIRGNELHRELIDLIKSQKPLFTSNNKETYLYITDTGLEVAALFKDGRVRFGLRENLVVNTEHWKIPKINSGGIF